MTPFPSITRWLLPAAACDRTLAAVLPAGRRRRESGVFWLGHRDATSVISAIAVPSGRGVVEAAGEWSVSAEVYAAIATWAKPRGLTLLAVVHTHVGAVPPKLSRTDRTQGIKVPDVLAVVIGRGGAARDPAEWGWFIYEGGDYRELEPDERERRVVATADEVEVVRIGVDGAGEQRDD